MRISAETAASLAAVLRRDLDAIDTLEKHAAVVAHDGMAREQIDSLGFTLHNIYNALENSFAQISLSFENHVKDRERWHRELLEKMFLDIPPLRPHVLPAGAREVLTELLGFRHVFRHAYDFTLDEAKLLPLWRRWESEGGPVKDALHNFVFKLKEISEPEESR
jgi:hypothetical protein